MRKLFIGFSLFVFFCASGQTSVIKKSALKSNDYGVSYTLPKTSLIAEAVVDKITEKRGPYYAYADRYLQLKDVITEDQVYYELKEVRLVNKGIPDPDASYLIEFKPGTTAPFVYLTKDNLLCSINAEIVLEEESKPESPKKKKQSTLDPNSILSEELLQAGSIAKMAEIAAKQIYRIRESRLNILTGEAEALPPDGEAMKLTISQLEEQEQALLRLFTGTTEKEEEIYETTLIPDEGFEKEILFRFSTRLGIVDPDDLGGAPIYISLTNTGNQPPLDPKEAEKRAKVKGIFYNVPGTGRYVITMDGKVLNKGETEIVQFGVKDVLAPKMFEDKKMPIQVTFYPETGAIKQIAQ